MYKSLDLLFQFDQDNVSRNAFWESRLFPHTNAQTSHGVLYCTMSDIFSLSYLNDRLMNFNFGNSKQDKPVPILSAVLRSDGKKNTATRALFRVNGVAIDYLKMDYIRRLCLSCSPEAKGFVNTFKLLAMVKL